MSRDNPSLPEVLDALAVDVQQRVRTCVPAKVVLYDPTRNVATVQVARKTRLPSGAQIDGDVITDRPVLWPRGGGAVLAWDLLPGDAVLLLVCDRQTDEFFVGGATVAAGDRMHSLTDAVVLPGIALTTDPIIRTPGTITLGREDATGYVQIGQSAPTMTIEGTPIKLGIAAVEPVTLSTALFAAIDAAIVAAIAAGTGAPGTTGTLAFTAFQTAWNAAKANAIATKTLAE